MNQLRVHTDALRTKLQGAGLSVGDAVAPGDPPHVTIYMIGGTTGGTLGAPDSDAGILYQITCTGHSRSQVEWLVDKVTSAIVGLHTLTVSGRSVPRVRLESLPQTLRNDNVQPPLFWATPRYRVYTTPA